MKSTITSSAHSNNTLTDNITGLDLIGARTAPITGLDLIGARTAPITGLDLIGA
jgi:hypothetical protein